MLDLVEYDEARATSSSSTLKTTSSGTSATELSGEVQELQPSGSLSGSSIGHGLLAAREAALRVELVGAVAFTRHHEWFPRLLGTLRPRSKSSAGAPDLRGVEARLVEALEDEPLEAGRIHPAEPVLAQALEMDRTAAGALIARLAHELEPPQRAALIRCLGRLGPAQVEGIADALISQALRSKLLLERDAAICALEDWGTRSAADILRAHAETEPDSWLADYASRVAASLA